MNGRIHLDFSVACGAPEPVPARDVWAMLQETGSVGNIRPDRYVRFDGTMTLVVDGASLMWQPYAIDYFDLIHLAPLAAGTVAELQQPVFKSGLHGEMRFERQSGDMVRYSLEVQQPTASDARARRVVVKRTIPLQPLADAWTYLWFRVRRLAAELGDELAVSATTGRAEYFPTGYFDAVDGSLIDYAINAPLEEVLTTPKSFG